MMDELIGKTLDRYKIMELLGEGGMGAVFRGHDVTLQRDVAIKVMHPHLSRKSDFQERFLREARTAARLDHTSIVEVYDFGQAQNMLYIVMEFIPGDNLRTLLKNLRARQQWIRLDEAVHLMKQVAAALDYAHRNGVLHRDIKPANIMLKPEPVNGLPYRPILTDLGLAKLMEGQGLTQEGTSLGTPPYMSPEQALGEETDGRSDVYSLGILLYELAVGQLPFPIKTLTDAIRYHTKETPPPPSSIYPEIPPSLEAVILKAIAKSPSDRFSDAGGLVRSLENALADSTQVAPAPTALEGAVSLLTQYQASLIQPRGASIINAFDSPPPEQAGGDKLQILSKDKTTRTVLIPADGLTIGRSDDNDIALDDTKASRNHARITFDGQAYRVVDLDSTNGTLLGNAKLLPGVPEVWEAGAALRIGDTWFRLVRAQLPASTALLRTDGTAVAPNLIHTSSGEARIGVFLETAQLTVEPGGSVTASLTIMNQSALVDHFRLAVEGIPSSWLPVPPSAIQLMPGAQQAITFVIQPPRDPASKAGRYPLTFRVTSQDEPGHVATVKGTLTLGVFSQFSTELRPQKIRAGRAAALAVLNRGNAQESFTVNLQDRGDELNFSPTQTMVKVNPGESGEATFQATPRKRRLLGGSQSHNISLQIKAASGEAQNIMGEVISRALIPMWVPPLLIILCILVSGAAGLLYNQSIAQNRNGTATAVAEMTQIFVISQTTDTDNDGIPDVEEAKIGTDATKADTDEDGLDDKFEVDNSIDPTNPDTDGDGLSDGDELNIYGTQPKNNDTDGDNLPDGVEVENTGTSPTNPDTDGDGIADNVDPDPGQPPTPTDLPTATPEPTGVPTVTPTPPPTGTPTPVPGIWSGTWQTSCEFPSDCGQMELTHIGNSVSGTFANGNGTINGTTTGNRLTGSWTFGGANGTIDFWISDNGKTYQGNSERTFDWCGNRPGETEPNPCGIATWYGEWVTRCATGAACNSLNDSMTLVQNGSEVFGTYAGGNGIIEGSVNGTTASGTWRRGGNTGDFSFYIVDNGSFNGNWEFENEWCGRLPGGSLPNPCLGRFLILIPMPIFLTPFVFVTVAP